MDKMCLEWIEKTGTVLIPFWPGICVGFGDKASTGWGHMIWNGDANYWWNLSCYNWSRERSKENYFPLRAFTLVQPFHYLIWRSMNVLVNVPLLYLSVLILMGWILGSTEWISILGISTCEY